MNNKLPPLWLVVGLMMFPQIVETIYSPVLTHIASQFRVSEGQASQTLSVYFLAFAAGVVCWGRLCDLVGRRPPCWRADDLWHRHSAGIAGHSI